MHIKEKHSFQSLRRFLALWASQSVSAMGTAMTNYALAVWAYGQTGTASSMTLLTLCSFLPTILLRFLAGAIADQWDKKRMMLLSDSVAALGSVVILVLYTASALRITHLYAVNFLLSCMNAFQVPAAQVATSLLVPKEQYARAGGLQAVSGAVVSILSPVLGSVVLAWSGIPAVLAIDLISFAVAFLTLLRIRFPKTAYSVQEKRESFWKNCLSGLRYLQKHSHLLYLILFFTVMNFLAKLGGDGLLSVFILAKTNQNQVILGAVQSSVALGILAGGSIMTIIKPSRDKVKAIFLLWGLIFLFNTVMSVCQSAIGWCLAAFFSYLLAAVMNVHWDVMMRSHVPLELQGRVFSTKDTLQNGAIPLGLYCGGVLADRVFEPLMAKETAMQEMLSSVLGTGNGSGIGAMFFLVGLTGFLLSFVCMNRQLFREQNSLPPKNQS